MATIKEFFSRYKFLRKCEIYYNFFSSGTSAKAANPKLYQWGERCQPPLYQSRSRRLTFTSPAECIGWSARVGNIE